MSDSSCPVQLLGLRVLVVEDDYFLAQDLSEELTGCGAVVLGPFPDVFSALVLLAIDAPPDVAILDVKLGDETVYPLADALQSIGVPIVFATAYSQIEMPPEYHREQHIEKPMVMATLWQAFGP